MSKFKESLKIETTDKDVGGRPVYRLLEDFIFDFSDSNSCISITVPKGFETDFASIPRFFWRIFPPNGKYNKAAVVHDYLYSTQTVFSRWLSDAIFREAMRKLDVPAWKRWLIWGGVRIGGSSFFVN